MFTPRHRHKSGSTEQTGYAHGMAALGWLTPRRRSATARSVLAGEAAAEAARKSSLQLEREREEAAAETATAEPAAPAEPEFPVVGDVEAAAFFDLDNTVMQGAAIFHFGRGLYKRKFFQRRELARFAWQQAWFRLAGCRGPRAHAGRPRQRPVHRQGPPRLRTDVDRRGDLRRVHGRPHLARHARPRPGPPGQPARRSGSSRPPRSRRPRSSPGDSA